MGRLLDDAVGRSLVSHAPMNCTEVPMSELVHLAARTYCRIPGSSVSLHYTRFSLTVRRTHRNLYGNKPVICRPSSLEEVAPKLYWFPRLLPGPAAQPQSSQLSHRSPVESLFQQWLEGSFHSVAGRKARTNKQIVCSENKSDFGKQRKEGRLGQGSQLFGGDWITALNGGKGYPNCCL